MKIAASIWIFYNFQIQKRIVSVEIIRGNTINTMTTVFGLHRCWKLHNRIYPIRSQSLLYNDQPGRQVDLTKVLPTTEVFWLNIEESYFACQVNASEKYLKIFKLSRLCDGNEDCYQGSDELSENHKCSSKCPSPCGSNGVCLKTR